MDLLSQNLGFLSSYCAEKHGERIALIEPQVRAVRARTYAELEDNANRVGTFFMGAGLSPGARVALIVGNQIEYIEALFGALRAGLVVVPISAYAGWHRIVAVLERAAPEAILLDMVRCAEISARVKQVPVSVRIGIGMASEGWIPYQDIVSNAGSACRVQAPKVASSAPALLMFTSGATGAPKAVVISHAAAISTTGLGRGNRFGDPIIINQRSLLFTPATHEAAFSSLKQMLAYGGAAVLADQFNPRYFLKILAGLSCTTAVIVPSMALSILTETELLSSLNFVAFQLLAIGGSPVGAGLLTELQRSFPRALILQFYGMTECGNVFTRSIGDAAHAPLDSLGVPAHNVRVKLGEDDDGEFGELLVRTPGMMHGYLNSAERGPFVDGWFRTGDLFFRDLDGNYYYRGRVDDMFVCAGENVFPLEIESIFLRHSSIDAVCVLAVADISRGQVPIVFVVLRAHAEVTEAALFDYYDSVGAAFSRPHRIIKIDELPMNIVGKVDQAALRVVLSTLDQDSGQPAR